MGLQYSPGNDKLVVPNISSSGYISASEIWAENITANTALTFSGDLVVSGTLDVSESIIAPDIDLVGSGDALIEADSNLILSSSTYVNIKSPLLTVSQSAIVNENLEVVGNITASIISASDSITGSLYGTSSWADSASYVETAQTASFVTTAQTASYVETAQTASFVTTAQTASFVTTAQTASYVETAQTASFVTTAQTASFVTTAQTASYVDTSNIDQPFGNITASGNISASADVIGGTVKTDNLEAQSGSPGSNGKVLLSNSDPHVKLRVGMSDKLVVGSNYITSSVAHRFNSNIQVGATGKFESQLLMPSMSEGEGNYPDTSLVLIDNTEQGGSGRLIFTGSQYLIDKYGGGGGGGDVSRNNLIFQYSSSTGTVPTPSAGEVFFGTTAPNVIKLSSESLDGIQIAEGNSDDLFNTVGSIITLTETASGNFVKVKIVGINYESLGEYYTYTVNFEHELTSGSLNADDIVQLSWDKSADVGHFNGINKSTQKLIHPTYNYVDIAISTTSSANVVDPVETGSKSLENSYNIIGAISKSADFQLNDITASIVSASSGITGSLYGTSSWAGSASYIETAQTASFVTTAQTASYVDASNIDQPFSSITIDKNGNGNALIVSGNNNSITANNPNIVYNDENASPTNGVYTNQFYTFQNSGSTGVFKGAGYFTLPTGGATPIVNYPLSFTSFHMEYSAIDKEGNASYVEHGNFYIIYDRVAGIINTSQQPSIQIIKGSNQNILSLSASLTDSINIYGDNSVLGSNIEIVYKFTGYKHSI